LVVVPTVVIAIKVKKYSKMKRLGFIKKKSNPLITSGLSLRGAFNSMKQRGEDRQKISKEVSGFRFKVIKEFLRGIPLHLEKPLKIVGNILGKSARFKIFPHRLTAFFAAMIFIIFITFSSPLNIYDIHSNFNTRTLVTEQVTEQAVKQPGYSKKDDGRKDGKEREGIETRADHPMAMYYPEEGLKEEIIAKEKQLVQERESKEQSAKIGIDKRIFSVEDKEKERFIEHVVAEGDYLGKIAKKFGVKLSDVCKLNTRLLKEKGRNFIKPGWKIRIPLNVKKQAQPERIVTKTGAVEGNTYIIKKGDSVWQIIKTIFPQLSNSQIWKVSLMTCQLNKIKDCNWIKPGKSLRIPFLSEIIAQAEKRKKDSRQLSENDQREPFTQPVSKELAKQPNNKDMSQESLEEKSSPSAGERQSDVQGMLRFGEKIFPDIKYLNEQHVTSEPIFRQKLFIHVCELIAERMGLSFMAEREDYMHKVDNPQVVRLDPEISSAQFGYKNPDGSSDVIKAPEFVVEVWEENTTVFLRSSEEQRRKFVFVKPNITVEDNGVFLNFTPQALEDSLSGFQRSTGKMQEFNNKGSLDNPKRGEKVYPLEAGLRRRMVFLPSGKCQITITGDNIIVFWFDQKKELLDIERFVNSGTFEKPRTGNKRIDAFLSKASSFLLSAIQCFKQNNWTSSSAIFESKGNNFLKIKNADSYISASSSANNDVEYPSEAEINECLSVLVLEDISLDILVKQDLEKYFRLKSDFAKYASLLGKWNNNIKKLKDNRIKDIFDSFWERKIRQKDLYLLNKLISRERINVIISSKHEESLLTDRFGVWLGNKRTLMVNSELPYVVFCTYIAYVVEIIFYGKKARISYLDIAKDWARLNKSLEHIKNLELEDGDKEKRIKNIIKRYILFVENRIINIMLFRDFKNEDKDKEDMSVKTGLAFSKFNLGMANNQVKKYFADEILNFIGDRDSIASKQSQVETLIQELIEADRYEYLGQGSKRVTFAIESHGESKLVIKLFKLLHGDALGKEFTMVSASDELKGIRIARKKLGGLIASLAIIKNLKINTAKIPPDYIYLRLQRSLESDEFITPYAIVESKIMPLAYNNIYDVKSGIEEREIPTVCQLLAKQAAMEIPFAEVNSFKELFVFRLFKKVIDGYCYLFEECCRRGVFHGDHKMSNCGMSSQILLLDTDMMFFDEHYDLDNILNVYYGGKEENVRKLFSNIFADSLSLFFGEFERMGNGFLKNASKIEKDLFDRLNRGMVDYYINNFKAVFNYQNIKNIWAIEVKKQKKDISPISVDIEFVSILERIIFSSENSLQKFSEINIFIENILLDKAIVSVQKILRTIRKDRRYFLQNERRKILQELEKSEKKYRLLAENIQDVIWVLDINTLLFTYVSPSSEELFGYTSEEMLDSSMEAQLTEDSFLIAKEILSEELKKYYQGDRAAGNKDLELKQNCKDGSVIWVGITTRFIKNDKGKITGILGTSRDISKRKRIEDNLKKSEQRYKALYKFSPDGVLVVEIIEKEKRATEIGKFIYANPAMLAMLGYTEKELMNMSVADIHPQEQLEYAKSEIIKQIRGEKILATHSDLL